MPESVEGTQINTVLTVDLASRFSSVCIMDSKGKVLEEFDSWGKPLFQFVDEILMAAEKYEVSLILIEDVPYGLSKQFMIKPVLRLQGILIHALGMTDLLEKTLFLNPSTWQRAFEGVWKGKAVGALAAAAVFGYSPPDMLAIHAEDVPATGKERAKVRAQLKKATTDYVDAFLMAKFAFTFSTFGEMYEKPGIQAVFI
jgi:hypothetical protein